MPLCRNSPRCRTSVVSAQTLGRTFAEALAAKDYDRIAGLLHPEIDFRGLKPNRSWEAHEPQAVVAAVLREWFEGSDEIDSLERLEADAFSDRERVGYRFRGRDAEGAFVVERRAYIGERDGLHWLDASALLGLSARCDGRTYKEHASEDGHCCQPQGTQMEDLPEDGRQKARERLGQAPGSQPERERRTDGTPHAPFIRPATASRSSTANPGARDVRDEGTPR